MMVWCSFAVAGFLGSLTGLNNLPFMPVGGFLSDFIARSYGMRGRLSFGFVTMISLGCCLVFLSQAHGCLILSIVAMQDSRQSTTKQSKHRSKFRTRRNLHVYPSYSSNSILFVGGMVLPGLVEEEFLQDGSDDVGT